MIKRLFEYVTYDKIDDMEYQFYNCTLNTTIGETLVGTDVECILVDFCYGTLTLFADTEEIKYDLRLKLCYD